MRSLQAAIEHLDTEVIVVDKNPDSGVALPVTAAFPFVSYVAEPMRGLSVGRNTGRRGRRHHRHDR